ncbi:MAG: Flp family type IVb pilin [Erythrobacter sp.]
MELSKLLKRIGNDNSGATAIEYGLIAALIVIAMLGALNSVASETISMWGAVTDEVSSVNGS